MSMNELPFILAKYEGNALSAPNIPSHTNAYCVARHTQKPTRSSEFPSQPPVEALDLPKRPAPAQIYCYPPTRDGNRNRTPWNGSTVESSFYNGRVPQFKPIHPGTQLLQEIVKAALSPVVAPGTSGTSPASPRSPHSNGPVGNESLPLPATTAANSSRNEAIPMSKYGRRIRCQDTSMGRCSANKIGCVVLFLTVAIIIAVGVFARS